MEKTYKLIVEYDGTDFDGWQIQPRCRTVQGVFEDALCSVMGKHIRVTAAGRTDSGVHASGQVVSFKAPDKMSADRLVRALNGNLPGDVTAVSASEMPEKFNARFDATARTYRYTITERRISIGKNYAWNVKYRLSRELLEVSTSPLNGHCDLRGFSKGDDSDDFSTIIYDNFWRFEKELMIFEIKAVRFFQHSVRSIIGTAVSVARGKKPPDIFKEILENRDRKLSGPTAPPSGLCLIKVDYGENNG